MSNNRKPYAASAAGFSLIELMAAIVILIFLVLIMTKMIDITSRTSMLTGKTMDVESEVRMVFDRFALDLNQAVNRPDVDWRLNKAVGNDQIGFWSQVRGYNSQRTLSSVNFRVASMAPTPGVPGSGLPQLERAARGVGWDDMVLGVEQDPLLGPTLVIPASSDYQLLGDQIFRLEFCYLLKDGSLSTVHYNSQIKNEFLSTRAPDASDDVSDFYEAGSWWTMTVSGTPAAPGTTAHYICRDESMGRAIWEKTAPTENISAIVMAVAIVDRKTRILLSDGQLNSLTNLFLDADDGADVLSAWNAVSDDPAPLISIHPLLGQTVRVYQRYFTLP